MLKRPFVSLSQLLKLKSKRNYWVPPNPEDINKLSLIKEKYEIKESDIKDIFDHMKNQEKQIKEIKDELTNQKKVIENITSNVKHINMDMHDIFGVSLINIAITYYIILKL
jgi:uncharacterized coiled-coil protein SlyX